eukprot:2858049-Amphidinium_carterae.1
MERCSEQALREAESNQPIFGRFQGPNQGCSLSKICLTLPQRCAVASTLGSCPKAPPLHMACKRYPASERKRSTAFQIARRCALPAYAPRCLM